MLSRSYVRSQAAPVVQRKLTREEVLDLPTLLSSYDNGFFVSRVQSFFPGLKFRVSTNMVRTVFHFFESYFTLREYVLRPNNMSVSLPLQPLKVSRPLLRAGNVGTGVRVPLTKWSAMETSLSRVRSATVFIAQEAG